MSIVSPAGILLGRSVQPVAVSTGRWEALFPAPGMGSRAVGWAIAVAVDRVAIPGISAVVSVFHTRATRMCVQEQWDAPRTIDDVDGERGQLGLGHVPYRLRLPFSSAPVVPPNYGSHNQMQEVSLGWLHY